MMRHKSINNAHFNKLKSVINSCVGSCMSGQSIVSNIQDASLDDNKGVYVYPSTSPINLDVIKLDDLTKYLKFLLPSQTNFNQLSGVDAICIDAQNEWYFFEFKNSDIKGHPEQRKSIRKKMLESLWYIFFMYSKAGVNINQLFYGDFTKFAVKHINYIIVGSQSKNTLYAQNIYAAESSGTHYTPPGFEQFVGYYFKNVYMLTELEIRNFIRDFKS